VPRKTYDESLGALRADVLEMGELVVDRLEAGRTALETSDEALAREVIEGDEEVNETYLKLEDRCVELFALQQPVASDLRLVTASFKILTDLERVGDLATNLAEYGLVSPRDHLDATAVDDIGREATDMLKRGLDAYAAGDPEACRTVAARDDALDALCQRASEQVARDLLGHGEATAWDAEALLDDVSRVLLTVRDLERVGDHAVNIAARTLYMVETDPELIY